MDENELPADEVAACPPQRKKSALTVWAWCVALLMGPALLVWFVRLAALFGGCDPGPGACHGMAFGAGLRDALELDWAIVGQDFVVVGVSLLATLAAFKACRPLLGTLTLLLLPILCLELPILAVLASRYSECAVSSDAIGTCQLWGASMGMSFHNAAAARDVLYGIFPYTFALTVMLGILGFFFARPRQEHPPAASQSYWADHDQP